MAKTKQWWVWEETSAAGRGFGPYPTIAEAQAVVDKAYEDFPDGQSSLKVTEIPYN